MVAAGAPAVRRLRRPHNLRYVQVPARALKPAALARTREGAACGRVLEPQPSASLLLGDGLVTDELAGIVGAGLIDQSV